MNVFDFPLPIINDPEDEYVPKDFQSVIDSHVHIFPDKIFDAIWKWFETNAWSIRYKLTSENIIKFLLDRGVNHLILLQYAHKPEIASSLNKYMMKLCKGNPRLTGLATIFPGEKNASDIIKEAFDMGLGGIKLHCHVQCFDVNSKAMDTVYSLCSQYRKPLVMHAGREPKSSAYGCDPYLLCGAKKVETVLKQYPTLKLCIPHLGADEYQAYWELVRNYDNIWLDTSMMISQYWPYKNPIPLDQFREDRIIYGSDFPNLFYSWDCELKLIKKMNLHKKIEQNILANNAIEFFSPFSLKLGEHM